MESDAFTEPQARRAARRAIVERVVTGRMNGDEIPGVKELMRNLREGRVWIAGQALAGHADRHGTAMLEGVVGAVLNQKVVLASRCTSEDLQRRTGQPANLRNEH